MEYPEFEAIGRSVWQQKAVAELKEKSIEETIKWAVANKLKIDAYADYYLATSEELAAIHQAQRKSTKCAFVEGENQDKDYSLKIFIEETPSQEGHDILDALVKYVKHLRNFLQPNQGTPKDFQQLAIKIVVPLETNYLLTIAKIRAVRFLALKLIAVYNNSIYLKINGLTNVGQYLSDNEHINIVRATTMAMAGIIGGCDTLEIKPFNDSRSEFSTRIARNIMNILDEESYLNHVTDSAAGSFFIENLTYVLIQETWRQFIVEPN